MIRNLNIWYNQIFHEGYQDKDISKIYNFIIKNTPDNNNLCLIHGDYKLDNLVIGANSKCLAVLDWELSAFGEPEVDLSFQMINWLIPKGVLYGIGLEWESYHIPSAEDFLSSYEKTYGKKVNLNKLNTKQIIEFSLDKTNNQINEFTFQISNKQKIFQKKIY